MGFLSKQKTARNASNRNAIFSKQNTRKTHSIGMRNYQTQRQQQQQQRPRPRPHVQVQQARPQVQVQADRRQAIRQPVEPQILVPPTVVTPPIRARRFEPSEDDAELTQNLEELVAFMATQPRRSGGAFGFLSNIFGNGAASGFPAVHRESPFSQTFMEPVTVRPTAAQVEAASRIDILAVPSSDNCAICQDSFTAHSNRRTLRACNHAFHLNCIDTWFQQNVHCPVCRHDVRETVTQ